MKVRYLLAALIGAAALASCGESGSSPVSAQDQAQHKSDNLQASIYIPHNNVEFNNYNNRQKISDNPSTILWCTAYFANPNVKPITVPIAGKLTSSLKRPYSTSVVKSYYQGDANYSPELPGPDGMYGPSTDYRYGFTPGGVYVDFTGVDTVCTTQPTVYQATSTDIVLKLDTGLNSASSQASAALAAGQQKDGTISPAARAQAEALLEGLLPKTAP